MRDAADLSGNLYGRLTVVSKSTKITIHRSTHWECKCECGNFTTVRSDKLLSGWTQSCGCLKREILIKLRTTHDRSYYREFKVWYGMRDRCSNPNSKNYPYYGGRGITVCDEWQQSFDAFYRDMGPRPSMQHTLDRKDNDKGYYKENCSWATAAEQACNKRNSPVYEFDGDTMTLTQWCRELGLNFEQVQARLRSGWSFEEAIGEKDRK